MFNYWVPHEITGGNPKRKAKDKEKKKIEYKKKET